MRPVSICSEPAWGANEVCAFATTAKRTRMTRAAMRKNMRRRGCSCRVRAPGVSVTCVSIAYFCGEIPVFAGGSVSQRFAGLQSICNALLSFALAAEGEKGFALEVKQVLFIDERAGSK